MVAYAAVAVVLVAAVVIGTLAAAKYLWDETPVVVITDDTAGMSPGGTDQTPPTSATDHDCRGADYRPPRARL